MYAYRPTILPNRLPAHPGYQQPTGPLARPLPQRAGMPVQGPRPLGAMDAIRGAVRIGGRWGANAVRRGPFQHDGKHSWSPIGVEIAPGSPFDFSDDMGPIDSLMQTPGSRPQQGQASVPSPRYGSGDVVPIGGDVPRVAQSGVVLPENAVGGYGMLSGRRPAYNSSQPLSGGLLRTGPINTAPTAQLPPNQMGYNWDLRQNNLSPLEQRQVSMDRRWQQADPAGPYSGTAGMRHFGPLASRPAPTLNIPAAGTVYGGRSQIHNIDGRTVGLGPHVDPATYAGTPQAVAGAAGRRGVFVQTGPPAYGLSPEMEERRQEAISRQSTNRQMLAANRNIRANQRYGAPLRPDLFPQAEAAYAQNAGGGGPLQTSVNALAGRYQSDEGFDYAGFAGGLRDRFRNDPGKAWKAFIDQGGTSADLQAAIDSSRPGAFSGGDPGLHQWLLELQRHANGQKSIAQAGLGVGRARGYGLGTSTMLTSQNQPGEPLPGYPSY